MSLMAMVWAMHLAPVPLQANGRRHTASVAVLIALADRTGSDDGADAFPSVSSLMTVTGLSDRGVQKALRALVDSGAIQESAAPIVAAKIARADKRPLSYDLNLTAVRYDLTEDELDHIARTVPLLEPHVDRMRRARRQAAAEGRLIVNDVAGDDLDDLPAPVDNRPRRGEPRSGRGEPRSPRTAHGVNHVPSGVNHVRERGEPRSPEPLLEPLLEPRPGLGLTLVSPGATATAVDNPEVVDLREDVVDVRRPRAGADSGAPVGAAGAPRPAWAGPGIPPAPDAIAEARRALAARSLRSSSTTPDRTRDGYLDRLPAYADRDPARHAAVAARALADLEDRRATS